jgi:periplasmic protein CpxP/Spy
MRHTHHGHAPALILAAVGAGLISGCHPGLRHACFHGSPDKAAGWIMKRISKELDLNQAQKAKLFQIKDEILAKHQARKPARMRLFDAILSETVKDSIDQAALARSIDEMHQGMEEMKPFLISKFAEFHAVLTPGQRVKLAELLGRFHQERSR